MKNSEAKKKLEEFMEEEFNIRDGKGGGQRQEKGGKSAI